MTAKDVQQANADLRRLIIDGGMEGMPAGVIRAAMQDHATELRAALLTFDASAGWLPICDAPKGKKLILGYRNELGKWRTIMGTYYLPKTLESDPEEDVPEDEDGYAQAGWYEEYESQQGACPVEFPPTHYMPLYAAPEAT